MNKLFSVMVLTALFFSACLPNEERCNYNNLTEKNLYNHTWNIDSFHAFVLDASPSFFTDTTYTNAGTFVFTPGVGSACEPTGNILFTRSDGSTANIKFTITDKGENINRWINIESPSLDGYSTNYNDGLNFLMKDNVIRIYPQSIYNEPEPGLRRYWEFKLTKK